MSHILIAHEDPGCSKSLWRLLRRNELKASIAESCNHALEQLKADGPEPIDLVITSHHKTEFNDGSFLAAIGKEGINIPVIVLSSFLDHAQVDGMMTDRSVLLAEPIEEQVLMDKLESVLNLA